MDMDCSEISITMSGWVFSIFTHSALSEEEIDLPSALVFVQYQFQDKLTE